MHDKKTGALAFFSIDASFAILVVVLSFSMFALLSSSAASFASSSAKGVSKTNIALRLSSYILNGAAAESGGDPPDSYVLPGELDAGKLQSAPVQQPLDDLVSGGTVHFAEVSARGSGGQISDVSSGQPSGENREPDEN